MSNPKSSTDTPRSSRSFRLALDTWAVLVALALALAIRLDLIKRIPW